MKSLKALKNRVRVVKNTKQITKALQMVSVAKMQKAQILLERIQAYSDSVLDFMEETIAIATKEDIDTNKIFFDSVNKDAPWLVVLFAPTRGFCGALVSSLQSFVASFVGQEKFIKNKQQIIKAVGFQKKSKYILESLNDTVVDAIFENPLEEVTREALEAEYRFIIDGYKKGEYAGIYLIYPRFDSIFSYTPIAEKLLPLEIGKGVQVEASKTIQEEGNEDTKDLSELNFKVEPSAEVFFKDALERYLLNRLMFAAINTKASEFSARTLAMKNATENAENLEQSLQLEFNKLRQESITSELLDIVGALPKKDK